MSNQSHNYQLQPQLRSSTLSRGEKTFVVILLVVIAGILISYFGYDSTETTAVMASTLRQSTPLLLGALCGLIGERSGIINIGIEGQMLMAAFASFYIAAGTGSLLGGYGALALGAFCGVGAGMILGWFLGWMSIALKTDQIIAGTVINILAFGVTSFFFFPNKTLTGGKIKQLDFGPLEDVPFFGKVLYSNPPITYIALIALVVIHIALFRTRWGLRTRVTGEHPSALDTVGINVLRKRYINMTLAGGIAGLAGAYLSLEAVGTFERNMTNGRGFLALAVMIFGRWTPIGAWGGALLFAFATAMQTQLDLSDSVNIAPQFTGMVPYLVTIIVLAGFVGRARPPAAIGVPYEPGK